MKKKLFGVFSLIIVIIIVLVITTINKDTNKIKVKNDNLNKEEETMEEESFLEVVPDAAKIYIESLDNEVLKSQLEINSLNQSIFNKSESMYDLDAITSMTRNEILKLINAYNLPSLPKYNKGKTITTNDTKVILDNRNLDEVKDLESIQDGVIIKRANLRSFPSNINFFESPDLENFDMLQETELLVNTRVLILHESKDSKWYFVISKTYAGWVLKSDIALLNDETREFFFKPQKFVVVTDASITIDDVILDMSVKLPYLGMSEDSYQVSIPTLGANNLVTRKTISIKRDKAHIGYLPYTKRNVIIEAFKYEGVPYSWSGLNQNVDCSSFVSNVFRTFGIEFPRNTSSQNKSIGVITSLKDKTNEEKLKLIETKAPLLLYQSGHVLLYIGEHDNKHYVIHASGDKANLKVLVNDLESTRYLTQIYQFNEIK